MDIPFQEKVIAVYQRIPGSNLPDSLQRGIFQTPVKLYGNYQTLAEAKIPPLREQNNFNLQTADFLHDPLYILHRMKRYISTCSFLKYVYLI